MVQDIMITIYLIFVILPINKEVHLLQEVEIKQRVPGKERFDGKITFKTMSHILQSKKSKADDILCQLQK